MIPGLLQELQGALTWRQGEFGRRLPTPEYLLSLPMG